MFQSSASNLVTGDTNGTLDIFLRDRNAMSNGTTRISVNAAGIQGDGESISPSVSSDGRYVAFSSAATNLITADANVTSDIFLYDATNGSAPLARVSVNPSTALEGDGSSVSPSMSSDGRYIAFSSKATNLVTGDTNGNEDIFLYDGVGPSIIRISVSSGLFQANGDSTQPQISSDGTTVVFQSTATNLVAEDTNSRYIFTYTIALPAP